MEPVVQTKSGPVRGRIRDGVASFALITDKFFRLPALAVAVGRASRNIRL